MNPADFAVMQSDDVGESGVAVQRLAENLGIAVVRSDEVHAARFLLQFSASGRLEIRDTRDSRLKPLSVDLKPRHGSRGRDPLLRAMGAGVSEIIDATAGLGVDAYHLASAGYQVTALEAHPVMHALLENGLRFCEQSGARSRIRLVHADAVNWLEQLPSPVDVVYLDPMYPPRTGSAVAKKGIRFLQDMIPHDPDRDRALLGIALERATRRVVVKRPHHAEPLLPGKSGDIGGKLVRFDIYPPAR